MTTPAITSGTKTTVAPPPENVEPTDGPTERSTLPGCDTFAEQRDEFFYGDDPVDLGCEWDAYGTNVELNFGAANELRSSAVASFLDRVVRREIFDADSLGNSFGGLDPLRRAFAVGNGGHIPLADLAESLGKPEALRDLVAVALSGAEVPPTDMGAATDAVIETLSDHYAGRVCGEVRGELLDQLREREREITQMIADGGSEEYSVDELRVMLRNSSTSREWVERELLDPRALLTTSWGSERAHALANELHEEYGASPGPIFSAEHDVIAAGRRLAVVKPGVDLAVGIATGGLGTLAGVGLGAVSAAPGIFAEAEELRAVRGLNDVGVVSDEQLQGAQRNFVINTVLAGAEIGANGAASHVFDTMADDLVQQAAPEAADFVRHAAERQAAARGAQFGAAITIEKHLDEQEVMP